MSHGRSLNFGGCGGGGYESICGALTNIGAMILALRLPPSSCATARTTQVITGWRQRHGVLSAGGAIALAGGENGLEILAVFARRVRRPGRGSCGSSGARTRGGQANHQAAAPNCAAWRDSGAERYGASVPM